MSDQVGFLLVVGVAVGAYARMKTRNADEPFATWENVLFIAGFFAGLAVVAFAADAVLERLSE